MGSGGLEKRIAEGAFFHRIGHAIIVFGTVREVTPAGNEPGFLREIAVTSAFIRQTPTETKN